MMKIDPEIMQRHLRRAAIEQVCRDLEREGYVIDAIEAGPLDVIARRGNEVVAAEVRVPGTSGRARMVDAIAEARRLGASFRLHLVQSEHRTVVQMDRLEESLLTEARRSGPETLGFPNGWTIDKVDDIAVENVVIGTSRLEVFGDAVVYGSGNAAHEGVAIEFNLAFDGERGPLDRAEIKPLED